MNSLVKKNIYMIDLWKGEPFERNAKEKCQSENGRKCASDKEKAALGILELQAR